MKLSKKKIQKLYKSKNQTRKSGGKKSFKPKQTNHRSRKAGALNLRRRTLRKMKGGEDTENNETDSKPSEKFCKTGQLDDNEIYNQNIHFMDKQKRLNSCVKKNVITKEEADKLMNDDKQEEKETQETPETDIVITEDDLNVVFEGFTKAREGENKVDAIDKVTTTDDEKAKEEKIVSFNNLSTYKEFMTKLANLMLGKLNEVYNKKISDMKEELLKNIEEKVTATGAQDEPADVKKSVDEQGEAATDGPEGKSVESKREEEE